MKRLSKKNIAIIGGYFLFSIILFVFFVILLFPREELGDRIIYEIENRTPFIIKFKERRWGFPLKLIFEDILLYQDSRGKNNPITHLDQLTITLPLKDMISLRPVSILEGTAYGGSINGVITSDRTLTAEWRDIELANIEKIRELPAALSGKVRGKLLMKFDQKTPGGNIRFLINNGRIAKINVMGLSLPEIKIKEFQGAIKIKNTTLSLENVRFYSEDFKGSIDGTISLKREKINLTFLLSIGEKMRKNYQPFLAFIEKSKDKKGNYKIRLKGNLYSPSVEL